MGPMRSSVNIDVNARLESFDDHAEPGYFNDVWSLSGGVEQQENIQPPIEKKQKLQDYLNGHPDCKQSWSFNLPGVSGGHELFHLPTAEENPPATTSKSNDLQDRCNHETSGVEHSGLRECSSNRSTQSNEEANIVNVNRREQTLTPQPLEQWLLSHSPTLSDYWEDLYEDFYDGYDSGFSDYN